MNLVSQIAQLVITMDYYITVSQQEGDAEREFDTKGRILLAINDQQVHTGVKNAQPRNQPAFLPTILYTNCRSLTQWKLEELAIYAELHKPDLICLTETWLTADKEEARCIDGYKNFFCNRKNRIGGGVAILAAYNLSVTHLSSHTTRTFSAIWLMVIMQTYQSL